MKKKLWIPLIMVFVGIVISLLGYAGARDLELAKTIIKVEELEKREKEASDERNEIIKAQNKANKALGRIEGILEVLKERIE